MSYTEAQIFNMALGHVGIQGHITSAETDFTNEAMACKMFYAHARDVIMAMMSWPFATVRQNLQLTSTAYDGWTYSYAYPNDCALFHKVVLPGMRTEPSEKKVPFRIVKNPDGAGKLIMTDMEQAIGEYNIYVTDPAEFDATFAHAVSLFLGTLIVNPLRVDPSMAKQVNEQFSAWQMEAAGRALREAQEDSVPDSEYQTGRN